MSDDVGCSGMRSLCFVVCVSDDELLESNLLASPCLADGSPQEVILVKSCRSAADGLNLGIQRTQADWTVCLHQDVVLPAGWDRQLAQQLELALRRFGPIGVAGVYGVGPAIREGDRSRPVGSAGCLTGDVSCTRLASCRRASPHSMNCCWLFPRTPRSSSTRRWDFISMERISACKLRSAGWLSLRSRRLFPQFSEYRAAAEVLPECGDLRPQMATPSARGHAVRDH